MDLFILTTALDRSAAAITSAAVVTPLVGPDDFPQLVLGTQEPFTVRHLSAAGAFETWSADPLYTVTVTLGRLSANGMDALATADLSSVVTNGKAGSLSLTTQALSDAIRALRFPRGTFVLQVTVTDDSGNKRVFAQIQVTVVGSVPPFTLTA
jgi:hypothetical protein